MTDAAVPFSPAEREFIRREFHPRFGSNPVLAEGIYLRTWRTGPQAGQPKIPKAMVGLLERGLLELDTQSQTPFGIRARFTEAGLAALRTLVRDRRLIDPERFAHLRRELGLDPAPAEAAE